MVPELLLGTGPQYCHRQLIPGRVHFQACGTGELNGEEGGRMGVWGQDLGAVGVTALTGRLQRPAEFPPAGVGLHIMRHPGPVGGLHTSG